MPWQFYVIAFIAIMLYQAWFKPRQERKVRQRAEERENQMRPYAHFEMAKGDSGYGGLRLSYPTLIVDKRAKELAECFEIRNHTIAVREREPEKYIYTSATVGGITTGGVDKVGGGYHKVMDMPTDKCKLLFLDHEIERITLSDELCKEAKKSGLKKYINGDGQIIVDTGPSVQLLDASARYGVASAQAQNLASAGYPSREKCKEIIAWLCGETE